MTLKAVVGIDYEYLGALTMALNDYNKDDVRKQFHQILTDSNGTTITVTILYSTVEPVVPVQQEPVWEFIGSKGISPNDPNWRELMDAARESQVDIIEASSIVPDGAHTITADTIVAVQLDVKRASEGT